MTRQKPRLLIAAVAVLILGVLAWLVWPSTSSGPTVLKSATGSHTIQLSVDAPKLGTNSFGVEVTDQSGKPARLDSVTVEPVMPQMGHALSPVTAGQEGPGRYRAAETVLPMTGQWEITISLHGPAGTEQAVFPLLVK
ncbi:FixH family protein [Amycolatopsis sp. cg5]|uniref:FixH family protein n=1 Tax=Amycolatopsis sp. cg5 TaxID=3238802 RepID=UPI0035259F26